MCQYLCSPISRIFVGIRRKIKDDIRQTSIVSQELGRRVSKTTKSVIKTAGTVIDDVSDIPSAIQQLSNRTDTWSLVTSGKYHLSLLSFVSNSLFYDVKG